MNVQNNSNLTTYDWSYMMAWMYCSKKQLLDKLEAINYTAQQCQLPCVDWNDKFVMLPKSIEKRWFYLTKGISPNEICFLESQRIALIYLLCFAEFEETSVYLFQKITLVSKNTTLNDIKLLRAELIKDTIELQCSRKLGFKLAGDEISLRKRAYQYITQLAQKEVTYATIMQYYAQFHPKFVFQIPCYLQSLFEQKNIAIVLNRFENSLPMLLFQFERSYHHRIILSESEIPIIEHLASYPLAKLFVQHFNQYKQLNNIEIYYFAIIFNTFFEGTLEDKPLDFLVTCSERIILNFERIALVHVKDKESLLNKLYNHLVPTYFRLKYDLYLENEFVNEIMRQYHDVFELTKQAISPLQQLLPNKLISDDEIAYISVLFGGELEMQKNQQAKHYRAIVACPNGISSSLILLSELKKMFPTITFLGTYPIEKINTLDETMIIFTTFPLKSNHHIFLCKAIMTVKEKALLIANVNRQLYLTTHILPTCDEIVNEILPLITFKKGVTKEKIINKLTKKFYKNSIVEEDFKPMLSDLLTAEMIRFSDEKLTWQQAIGKVAEPLLQSEKINEHYIDAMIAKVEELGAFIKLAPGFALPHARPEDGVNALGMSLLKLEYPIYLLDDPKHEVNLLICLAAIDNEAHLRALRTLTKLLIDKASFNQLLSSNNKEQILKIIQQVQ